VITRPRWRISATQWIFGAEDLDATCARLASLGYDGVELAGIPDACDARMVRDVVGRHGLAVTSICGMYPADRDLSSPDPEVRSNAVRYVRQCSELAAQLEAPLVIVVPGAVGRVSPVVDAAEEWELAVVSITAAADAAAELGVKLALEALNRYESYFLRTLEMAARLAGDVDRQNVGLMADLFHMNIEEADMAAEIRRFGELIWHVHMADSNRRPPGLGHTEIAAVILALKDIDYGGSLTMEFMPSMSNPYDAASLDAPEAEKTAGAGQAIEHIRAFV
jgi:sugar phosphate isomerase/epimerase